jgi:ribosomal protein S18 acetylase RimI-like enzyme
MPVICRPARARDLEFADSLVVSSINNLTERHGFGPMAVCSPPKFQLFSLKDDADGLWVAEEGERILGFAWSWVCGDMWFLAQLFVSPDHQGRSVGNELIRRTLDHAEKSSASNRVLITFSFNTVSQGLYIRHGLLQRIARAIDGSFARPAIRRHAAQGRSFDLTPPRASGRAGPWRLA